MRDTAGEVRTNSEAIYSSGLLHMEEQSMGDQPEAIYNRSVLIEDITWKTYQERSTIKAGGERVSVKSAPGTWHDDDIWLQEE